VITSPANLNSKHHTAAAVISTWHASTAIIGEAAALQQKVTQLAICDPSDMVILCWCMTMRKQDRYSCLVSGGWQSPLQPKSVPMSLRCTAHAHILHCLVEVSVIKPLTYAFCQNGSHSLVLYHTFTSVGAATLESESTGMSLSIV